MFKIMQALLALNQASEEHGTHLMWETSDIGQPYLIARIPISPEDVEFVNNMRTLLGAE